MNKLRFLAAGVLGQGLVGGLFTSTRLEREDEEHLMRFRREGRNLIFVFWHGQVLPLIHYHRAEGIVGLVSEHIDGEYIAGIMQRHGFGTARGSSTRGGSKGLRELIRAAREGRDLALTPDGPKGPAGVFKPGALRAAQMTGLPVMPVGVAASSAWRFDSWDRFLVPKPMARVRIVYGEPVLVPRDASEARIDELAHDVGDMLRALTKRAEAPFEDGA